MMTAFHKWVDFHGKEYASHEEKMTRLQIWAENNSKWNIYTQKVGGRTHSLSDFSHFNG